MGFETAFFAIVAILVIGRPFQVLGQNHGAPPPFMKDINSEKGAELRNSFGLNGNETTESEIGKDQTSSVIEFPKKPVLEERFSKFSETISKIQSLERDFNPSIFEKAATGAFEIIVSSFGKGDENTLKDLTTSKVFEAYQAGMVQRKSDGKGPIDIIKLNEPKIVNIEVLEDSGRKIANIDVEFGASLSSPGEKVRNTNEIWTFEKTLGDKSPVWLLSAVHSS